ncbi:ECF-type sigma factor [Pseudomonas sp. CGJS7]|uniref:ECF-type sigma factor n=1 Tax=Pseudomonas sp. CGJS7 TaxID=3109348 RepID=UPI00300A6FB6
MTQESPSHDPLAKPPAPDEFEFPEATLDSVTQLIVAAQNGQPGAWDRVYTLLYRDLHEAASLQIRRRWRRGNKRSPTSLINRTWLRLNQNKLTLNNRQHLLAVLSQAMRYALLDEVRRLKRLKYEESYLADKADPNYEPSYDPDLDQLLAIDRALEALSAVEPRLTQLVEMRYFAGMSDIEIGEVLGLTDRTIRRDWRKARAFLAAHLKTTPDLDGEDDAA